MKRPDHILVVNVHFDPDTYGGATIVASQVIRRLQAAGHRISAVAAMQNPDLPPYTVIRSHRAGIDTYRINLPQGPSHLASYQDERATARMVKLVQELRPDLVHLHCLQGLGAGLLPELRALGLPSILSIHDFWWICERQFMVTADGVYCGQDPVRTSDCAGCVPKLAATRARAEYLYQAAACADLITFPSAFAHGLSLRSGLPARRGVIWENGVTSPGPNFFEIQAARRARAQRMTFGFVGGPSSVKGWPLIRAAFQRMEAENFAGVVVDGSLDGSWWRPSMLQGMRGEWSIHPRYDQAAGLDRFFAHIDVLLFVSQWREAFGLVVREAISRGVRVIQTAGGGAAEHPAQARTLEIGAGPEALSEILDQELRRPHDHPAPVPCRSFDDQSQELLGLIDRL